MSDDAKVVQLLTEAVRWLRFQSIDRAKATVADLLDTEQKKLAFNLADGVLSARSVASQTGVGNGTISRWWSPRDVCGTKRRKRRAP